MPPKSKPSRPVAVTSSTSKPRTSRKSSRPANSRPRLISRKLRKPTPSSSASTPLKKNREPDISYILKTGEAIAPHLHKGILVVLESTTYPGTTDEDLRGVLEKNSGLKAG